jgi:hypothetical protein
MVCDKKNWSDPAYPQGLTCERTFPATSLERLCGMQSLFKLGMKSLHEDADDEIVAKLHVQLLLKVFHAEIADDVKYYQDSKSRKKLTNESSNVSFRTALKCASKKHDNKT